MDWLSALRALSTPVGDAAPETTRTHAWAMKQSNTQLASWSQLRHDTILYVKQSYTGISILCYYPEGYVEPSVEFWAGMGQTAERAADTLVATKFPSGTGDIQLKQVGFLRKFAGQMSRLKAVAVRQRDQKPLDREERDTLQNVMQLEHHSVGSATSVHYNGWYPGLFYKGSDDSIYHDALVADVHTDAASPDIGDQGCVLHEAVGNIDLMIIAIDNGKDRIAYVGPTLSYYEFELGGTARKTDEEWKADLANGKRPSRPEWTRSYLVPLPPHQSTTR